MKVLVKSQKAKMQIKKQSWNAKREGKSNNREIIRKITEMTINIRETVEEEKEDQVNK